MKAPEGRATTIPTANMELIKPCTCGTISGGNSSLTRLKLRGNIDMPMP